MKATKAPTVKQTNIEAKKPLPKQITNKDVKDKSTSCSSATASC